MQDKILEEQIYDARREKLQFELDKQDARLKRSFRKCEDTSLVEYCVHYNPNTCTRLCSYARQQEKK